MAEASVVPIDHVICPVDLSPASANALRHAQAWARWYEAPLRVLHVAPLPQALVSGTGQAVVLPTRPLEAIRADVERFVTDTIARDSLTALDVVQGHPVAAIVEEAARWPHSLLVMGTQGRTGLDRLLLGSVTEHVAHGAGCPLLVVPPRETTGPWLGANLSKILCSVDFRPSSLAALRYALSLAQGSKATIEVVTVIEPNLTDVHLRGRIDASEADRQRCAGLLQALRERIPDDVRERCTAHEEVLTGSPAEVLRAHAANVGAELIVMGSGERRHLHVLWLGSTTGRLLRTSCCPVLIVPPPPRPAYHDAKPLPRRDWERELERLSVEHQGERASIAIVREDMGTQREAFGLPLVGVTADLRGGAEEISVMLKRADGTGLTHVIANPQDIRVSEADGQHDLELLILGSDGSTTRLGIGAHQ